MKTTIKTSKQIKLNKKELIIWKELFRFAHSDTLYFDEEESKTWIDRLIDVNPEKQEHKDFIMEFIKELKR